MDIRSLKNTESLCGLYPPIEPYQSGFLEVDAGHSIYFEESGNPKGKPILFFHGGPGLGSRPHNRCFFDPDYYRIILFDQRGCGKSLPFASLENNTTWHLVRDIEQLRVHLKVEKWLLFGGSWGSTLALIYAIKYPDKVEGLILRGIFLCRLIDLNWFFKSGANFLFPDFWEDFVATIPPSEREGVLNIFYNRLIGIDSKKRNEAAKAWATWGGRTYKLNCDPMIPDEVDIQASYPFALIECYYLYHQAFLETDNWILENIKAICHLPCILIQGRYDVPCPMQGAWDLHKAWPGSKLQIISGAGHSSSEPFILDALIHATDFFKQTI